MLNFNSFGQDDVKMVFKTVLRKRKRAAVAVHHHTRRSDSKKSEGEETRRNNKIFDRLFSAAVPTACQGL
jgi:hypothetical protein